MNKNLIAEKLKNRKFSKVSSGKKAVKTLVAGMISVLSISSAFASTNVYDLDFDSYKSKVSSPHLEFNSENGDVSNPITSSCSPSTGTKAKNPFFMHALGYSIDQLQSYYCTLDSEEKKEMADFIHKYARVLGISVGSKIKLNGDIALNCLDAFLYYKFNKGAIIQVEGPGNSFDNVKNCCKETSYQNIASTFSVTIPQSDGKWVKHVPAGVIASLGREIYSEQSSLWDWLWDTQEIIRPREESLSDLIRKDYMNYYPNDLQSYTLTENSLRALLVDERPKQTPVVQQPPMPGKITEDVIEECTMGWYSDIISDKIFDSYVCFYNNLLSLEEKDLVFWDIITNAGDIHPMNFMLTMSQIMKGKSNLKPFKVVDARNFYNTVKDTLRKYGRWNYDDSTWQLRQDMDPIDKIPFSNLRSLKNELHIIPDYELVFTSLYHGNQDEYNMIFNYINKKFSDTPEFKKIAQEFKEVKRNISM